MFFEVIHQNRSPFRLLLKQLKLLCAKVPQSQRVAHIYFLRSPINGEVSCDLLFRPPCGLSMAWNLYREKNSNRAEPLERKTFFVLLLSVREHFSWVCIS